MNWHLRRARSDDAPALALVAGATFLETFCATIPAADLLAHVSGKSSAAAFDVWIDDPAAAVFHAVHPVTDAPLGYAVLTAPDFPVATRDGDIELRRIYTLAATHGSGLGPALLVEAVAESRMRSCSRMLLGVHPDNVRARRFYERSGFHVVGERAFHVGASRFVDPIYALDL